MKKIVFALTILTAFSATAREVATITEWTKSASASLIKGDAKTFQNLMNTQTLATQILAIESEDRKNMRLARVQFTAGKFAEARALYDEVEKSSDYWLEAVEEKGWAFHREKSFDKTLAQTKTLLAPTFAGVVGAEPFFLQSLSALKICDYKVVLGTHKSFKESQKVRMLEIQNLAETGQSEAVNQAISKINKFPVDMKEVGEAAKKLPRLFHRDLEFQKAVLLLKTSEAAKELFAVSAKNSEMGTLRNQEVNRLTQEGRTARAQIQERMRVLATIETEENAKIIQKLNLIEVETIQRLHADRDANLMFTKGEFKKTGTDDLVFADDGHPWMDELDKYEVKVNKCPQNVRRKM